MSEKVLEAVKKFFDEQIPFNKFVGIHVIELGEGTARVGVRYRDELVGDALRPALHGGVLSALIDAAGGAAAFTTISLAGRLSTIDLRVDYLRPGDLKDVVADAVVSRVGNRVASVDITAYHPDEPDRLIATGKAVYNLKRGD